jgi:DnaJ-class molecular chaperone
MSLPELEVKCWRCWGNGMIPSENHGGMVECEECNGLGWVPTEDGKRLLTFIQRHLAIEEYGEEELE